MTSAKVDAFMERAKNWQEEFALLREILLASGLDEDLKWGQPCYTLEGRNVVLLHGFKEYCALLFFKGALLKDPKGILVQQTENVQSARQVRFTTPAQVSKLKPALKSYIAEAIKVEQSGEKVEFKKTAEFVMPEEFQSALSKSAALRNAFEELTPGRQRAYILHFASAKQSRTRESRIEKCTPLILDGLGLDDKA